MPYDLLLVGIYIFASEFTFSLKEKERDDKCMVTCVGGSVPNKYVLLNLEKKEK